MEKPIRILLAGGDDEPGRKLADSLQKHLAHAQIAQEALFPSTVALLDEGTLDCVVVMEAPDADSTLTFVRRAAQHVGAVVVIAGQPCTQRIVQYMKAGAADCLDESSLADNDRLARSLRSAIDQRSARGTAVDDALFRRFVEELPFDCWARDAQGRGTLQNPFSRNLWGNVLGVRPQDCCPDPHVLEDWLANNNAAMAGQVVHKEMTYRFNGEDRHYFCIIAPMRQGGQITGLIGANIDITDLKRTESALRESQELFEQFMGRSPVAAYLQDEQGRFLYTNETLRTAFGIDADRWPGKRPEEIWPGELGQRIAASDRAALAERRPAEVVEKFPHADGMHTWLVYRYPLIDARGRRLLAAMGIDVTQQQRGEERLREAELRYRTVFEQSQHGIMIVDPLTTAIVDFNSAAHRQLGYARDEFARLSIQDLDITENSQEMREHIERILTEGGDEFETRLRTRSGEIRDFLASVTPIRINGRTFLHGVVQDITERNRLKEQLIQSQKMEAIGRLAGGVAHDFNNLLAVISGYSESLTRRLDDLDPLKGHALEIQKAAERGGALTRQLLAFSRRQIVRPRILDLSAVVLNLQEMLRRVMSHEVEISFQTDPEPCWVTADQGQMEQVIVNLALNARDAMPEGGSVVIQTLSRQLDEHEAAKHGAVPGAYRELIVSDTGIGMDAATAARVFEPFFTTKEGKGTGLGLSIVYGIVQQAGGRISVRSQTGQGATFTVLFPSADALTALQSTGDPPDHC